MQMCADILIPNRHSVQFKGNACGRLVAFIYSDCGVVLARKAAIAAAIMEHILPENVNKRAENSKNAGYVTAAKKTAQEHSENMRKVAAVRWSRARV